MRVRAAVLALAIALAGCALFRPAPPPSPPAPPPPRPSTTPKETPAPPPVLATGVSSETERGLTIDARGRIDGTERLVRQIESRKLAGEQQESFLTIQSFLGKSREALLARDVQRAFTLADKAYLLADDPARRLK
jgi:hypothetical protein